MREGICGIVSGMEKAPTEMAGTDESAKFSAWSDRALATVVLAVNPSLLYFIADPVDPAVIWQNLAGQFQKKTWVLYFMMKLSDAGSMQDTSRV